MAAKAQKAKKEPTYDFTDFSCADLRDICRCISILERSGIGVPENAIVAVVEELETRPSAVVCTVGDNGRYTFTETLRGDDIIRRFPDVIASLIAHPADKEAFFDSVIISNLDTREDVDAITDHFLGAWFASILDDPNVKAPWMEEFNILYLGLRHVEEGCDYDGEDCDDDDCDFDIDEFDDDYDEEDE